MAANRHDWWTGLKRLIRLRLIIPLHRTPHSPEFTARGVSIGMLVAMTPTIGIQMLIVASIWVILSRLIKWEFSLVAGLAYTWVTNAFTAIPIYYVFYVTGQVMTGHIGDINGFDRFSEIVGHIGDNPDIGFWETVWIWTKNLFTGWGKPMFIGSIPWAIFSAWLSYVLTRKYILHHRHKRATRAANRRRARQLPAE